MPCPAIWRGRLWRTGSSDSPRLPMTPRLRPGGRPQTARSSSRCAGCRRRIEGLRGPVGRGLGAPRMPQRRHGLAPLNPLETMSRSLCMSRQPSPSSAPAAGIVSPVQALPPCKLLEEMRANAAGNWTMKDVETLCNQLGLECAPPRRGSHFKVFCKGIQGMLTIPAKRPIKAPYIRNLVALADVHRKRSAAGAGK